MDPTELIERIERLTGVRNFWDSDDPSAPAAMAQLAGAVARETGQTPPQYTKRDDFAVGTFLLAHKNDTSGDLLAMLLMAGMSPDDLAALLGRNEGDS